MVGHLRNNPLGAEYSNKPQQRLWHPLLNIGYEMAERPQNLFLISLIILSLTSGGNAVDRPSFAVRMAGRTECHPLQQSAQETLAPKSQNRNVVVAFFNSNVN